MDYEPDSPPGRILKAARALFFSNGFERVSTEMLAKEASVSKTTLYKYFPSMVEVLKAVTAAEADVFEAGIAREVKSLADLETTLVHYGTNLLTFLNQPEILQFSQLMHEEARRHPDIAAAFYTAAYGRTLRSLENLFDQAAAKGVLESSLTSRELAEQLLGMWEGVPVVRAHMGVAKIPFAKPGDWAAKCVRTLLG